MSGAWSRRRAAVVALVIAAPFAAGAVPAQAGAAHPAAALPRVVLTAHTVLVGDRSGELPVYLPHPTTITMMGSRITTSIVGNGRFVGFEMRQDGPGPTDAFEAIRSGECTTPGCRPKDSSPGNIGTGIRMRQGSTVTVGESGTLPAGDYELILVADGAPARVTLPVMPGLGGRPQVLSHWGPAPVQIVAATPTVQLPAPGATPAGGPVLFVAGATRAMIGWEGSVMLDLWADQPLAHEATQFHPCMYVPRPPSGLQPAYAGLCSGAVVGDPTTPTTTDGGVYPYGGSYRSGPATGPAGLTGDYVDMMTAGLGGPPETMSIGGSLTNIGPVTDAHLNELWTDWGPTP